MLYILIYMIVSYIYYNSYVSDKQMSKKQFGLIMLVLALIVGLGDMLGGYDRYIYCDLFDSNTDRIRAGGPFWNPLSPLMGYKREAFYVIWNCLLAYITENRYIFILITTLAVYTLLFISFKNYLKNYPLTIIMFMGLWFFFTFTYLRQVMAASCIWLAYRYVIDKKMWKFLLVWYIAYKFHNSAVIFLPFYFIPKRKWSPKSIIISMIILTIIGGSGIPLSSYSMYGDASGTAERANQYGAVEEGFRVAYLIEAIVFLYFILKRYNEIPETREHLVFLNAALFFCGVLLFFIQSSNAGRQSWYFMLGIIYILVYLCSTRKTFDSYARYVYLMVTALFLRIVFGWGILISPYKTFLTNGHRDGDHIYMKFEYDEKYDQDKFYRMPFSIYIP